MQEGRRTWIAPALLAALVLAAGGMARLAGQGASAPGAVSSTPAADPGAAGIASLPDVPAPRPAAMGMPQEALEARLQRLSASAAPRDAWQAYRLVRACMRVQARAPEARDPLEDADPLAGVADATGYCSGMTERMRSGRIALVERAARGGVDAAMAALVEEGPFGDPSALLTRPDDPLVREWKDHVAAMLGEQAGQGNWTGLYLLFTGFAFGNPAIAVDRQNALAYGLALRDIVVRVDGLTEDQAIPFNGPFLDQVRSGLTPEQQAQAAAHAAAIVDTAVRQRQRSVP